jgi:hypothetical protein
MVFMSKATTREIEAAIESTVKAKLGAIVDEIETRFEDNQLGEPAIFVDIFLTEDAPTTLGKRFTEMHLAVMAALEARGELRFPYVSTKWPNDEYPEDVEPPKPRRRA